MKPHPCKAIIVEGKTDKARLLEVLNEEVEIICTYGTIKMESIENLVDLDLYHDVFVLADADEAGERLRRKIKNTFPQVKDIYTQRKYREVATTPLEILAQILRRAHCSVKDIKETGFFQ
jgi:toprim domain protein